MLRTVKAYSLDINGAKWERLVRIAQAYASEKGDHLSAFNTDSVFVSVERQEQYRDALLDAQYTSPHQLQARMWKLAAKDAHETVLKNWAALAVDLRGRVARQTDWTAEQKHYANWLLKNEQRLAELVDSRAPLAAPIKLNYPQRKQVQNYLRREVRRHRGRHPQVRTVRSVGLDADMYDTFVEKDTLYIRVMTLEKRQWLVLPLTGKHVISGTIRVVLDFEQQRIEVHYTAEVAIPLALQGQVAALDAGLSEVFTDERGTHYGPGFGHILRAQSDTLCAKGKHRNKLHQLAKTHRATGNFRKANHIHRFNLGTKKQKRQQRQAKAEIERQVNTAINEVVDQRQPSAIISEKLDMRGKTPSKTLSRRVSGWVRGTLDERLEFKASARGSCRKHVNPAYSSQTCPDCGFLDKKNRRGDTFQCRYCGHTDDADRVAAHNLKARTSDPDITLCTPKARVKAIGLDRFNARL